MGIRELLSLYSSIRYPFMYRRAKTTKTCVLCGKSAKYFRDTLSRMEYGNSALCQECQDKHFKNRK